MPLIVAAKPVQPLQVESGKYAVVVGIGTERMNMDGDARLMSSILNDAGFEVKTFLNNKAKRQDVLDALDWLAGQAEDSQVVYFFSGHGSTVSTFMWDATISVFEMQDILSGFISNHQLVIVHCCFAHSQQPYYVGDNRIVVTSMTSDYTPKLTQFGYFFLDQAIKEGLGDYNEDGKVSIQEAVQYAAEHSANTAMVDNYGSPYFLGD